MVSTSLRPACSPSRSARTRSPTISPTPSTPGYKADRTSQSGFGELLLANSATGATVGSQGTAVQVSSDRDRLLPQARPRDRRAAGLRDRRRGLLRRADRPRHALHAQRPVHRRRAGPPRDRPGRPGARPRRQRRSPSAATAASTRARSRSSTSSNPRKDGDSLVAGTPARQRRRPGPRRRARGLRRRRRALDGRHDRRRCAPSRRARRSSRPSTRRWARPPTRSAASAGLTPASSRCTMGSDALKFRVGGRPLRGHARRTELRGRRHGGTAAAPRLRRQRPGEREHDRLQAQPRRVPRPRLPAGRPACRRRASARDTAPPRSTPARRSPRARSSAPTARSTSPSRATASCAIKLGRRHPGADARRQPAGRRPRPPDHQHRRAAPAADHDPRGHRRGRRRDRAPTARSPPTAAASASSRSSRVRAPQALTPVGDNAFVHLRRVRQRRPPRRARPRSSSGALEASNVDMATSMVSMIESQRAFELASQGHPHGRPDVGDRQRGQAMSIVGLDSLPQVPETALPASVRNGSAKDKEAYRAALGLRAGAAGHAREVDGRHHRPARRGRLRRPRPGGVHQRPDRQRRPRPRRPSSTGP